MTKEKDTEGVDGKRQMEHLEKVEVKWKEEQEQLLVGYTSSSHSSTVEGEVLLPLCVLQRCLYEIWSKISAVRA